LIEKNLEDEKFDIKIFFKIPYKKKIDENLEKVAEIETK
jgi:hypothetical protein